jgi:hypothetical protein
MCFSKTTQEYYTNLSLTLFEFDAHFNKKSS